MKRAELAAALSRAFCGIVFVVHGTPKIMNLSDTVTSFQGMGFPGWMAFPVAFLEFFGGLILIAGFLTRIVAAIFTVEMLVAAIKVHFPNGFDVFEGGYEYNLALIVLLATVILVGPGRASIDAAIASRGRQEPLEDAWSPPGGEEGEETSIEEESSTRDEEMPGG